jgi:hypothetical protein
LTARVEISGTGRSGTLTWREAEGVIPCHWEFGGNDVLAVVHCGSVDEWGMHYPWAVSRRPEILRHIAGEVIRQQAPGSQASIDNNTGVVLIRSTQKTDASANHIRQKNAAWVWRYRDLRAKLGLIVLAGTIVFAAAAWVKTRLLVIDPGKGTPVGLSVRTHTHVATLLQTLVPYTPSPNRDHSKDRYDISVFLVPLGGEAPHLILVARDLSPNQFALAKILGSDGQKLWIDVSGIYTVDLSSNSLQSMSVAPPHPLEGGPTSPFPPRPESFLAAGLYTSPDTWLGLHSDTEIQREYQPDKRVRKIVNAENRKETRRFFQGTLDGETLASSQAILSMTPLQDDAYLNAALIRLNGDSEPFQLEDPPGAVMIYTSDPGLQGVLVVAGIDFSGHLLWQANTGIDRFSLQQILPGNESTAFIGTRPREEGQVPEPLLVIVHNSSGAMATHSLWQ